MASKRGDLDLIAQVVRELEAAGEPVTFDAEAAALAVQTTAKQPRLGPGPRLSRQDTGHVVARFGPAAVAALGDVDGALHVRGDARVCWVTRVEPCDPEDIEIPIVWDGVAWRDAPTAPERLAAVLGGLALDLADDAVRESVLAAAEALVGAVPRSLDEAVALTIAGPGALAAPPELIARFEPPHLAGDAFIFGVNLPWDFETDAPAFLRCRIHLDTGACTFERLCRGAAPADAWRSAETVVG